MSEGIKTVDDLPIINESSLAGQVTSLARHAVSALGGYLVARGMISGDVVEIALAITTTATPMLIGMAVARLSHKKLKTAVEVAKGSKDSAG